MGHSMDFFITPPESFWWAESEINFFLFWQFLHSPLPLSLKSRFDRKSRVLTLKSRFLELSSAWEGLKIVKIKKKFHFRILLIQSFPAV